LARILSIPERIKLFKEINRVHKEMYGWQLLYDNGLNAEGRIDIDRDLVLRYPKEWVPMTESDARHYYFYDVQNRDITLLRGLFAWEAWYFHHLNPYKFDDEYRPSGAKAFESRKLTEEDFISNNLGKRIRPDIDHPVRCQESLIEVQQRKDDGKIWISSNWLYLPECYGSASYVVEEVYPTITKTAEGDERLVQRIKEKFEQASELNRNEFMMLLERYFRGDRLRGRHWEGGYVFAASRTWRIKTLEQLNEALKVEDRHFQIVLDQYIRWLRSKVIKLHEEDEIALKNIISSNYNSFPRSWVIDLCNQLFEEEKVNPSDVYLWWGGEPNRDANYAILTLFFELDPEDIGTSRFDEEVSRNLRALINISEKNVLLHSYREYLPLIWRAIFS
jgi:hypothetical protein